MESVRCARAMCRGIGQWIDDLQLLDDRAGPSVRDDERQRIFMFRTNVNEMNVQPIDLGDEIAAGRSVSPRTCANRSLSPNSARVSASSRAARLAIASVTVSRSGHFVALMRLRNSVSSASGTFTLKRTNRILVSGRLAAFLCSTGCSHGVVLLISDPTTCRERLCMSRTLSCNARRYARLSRVFVEQLAARVV